MSGSKRRSLSLGEKVNIIELLKSGKSNADISKDFHLSSSSVSTIWVQRDKILEASSNRNVKLKRLRQPVRPDVDNALLEWFTAQRRSNVPISGPMMQEKAESLAQIGESGKDSKKKFVCTASWIDRFKKRYNIKAGKMRGEAESEDNLPLSKLVTSEDSYVEADTEVIISAPEMKIENCDIFEEPLATTDDAAEVPMFPEVLQALETVQNYIAHMPNNSKVTEAWDILNGAILQHHLDEKSRKDTNL